MTLAAITIMLDDATADQVATWCEYVRNADANDDPFARQPSRS